MNTTHYQCLELFEFEEKLLLHNCNRRGVWWTGVSSREHRVRWIEDFERTMPIPYLFHFLENKVGTVWSLLPSASVTLRLKWVKAAMEPLKHHTYMMPPRSYEYNDGFTMEELFIAYCTEVFKRTDFNDLPLGCRQEIEQLFTDFIVGFGVSFESLEVYQCLMNSELIIPGPVVQICARGEGYPQFVTSAEHAIAVRRDAAATITAASPKTPFDIDSKYRPTNYSIARV